MFKVLCLDGGGIRGLYTIKVLEYIEREYNLKICEYFDLIIGTSTGSIIASLLSLGYNLEEIYTIYEEYGKEIFKFSSNKGIISPRYDINILYKIVEKYLGDKDYESLKTNIIIPTVNISKAKIELIKSENELNKNKKKRFKLLNAVVASCSAPIYFSPHKVDNEFYVDGSLAHNNPSLLALSEGCLKGYKLEEIKILSVGTGKSELTYNENDLNNTNLRNYTSKIKYFNSIFNLYIPKNDMALLSLAKPLVEVTMKISIDTTEYILKNILKNSSNYVRINDLCNEKIHLDKIPNTLLKDSFDNFNKLHKKELNKFFENKSNLWKKVLNIFRR